MNRTIPLRCRCGEVRGVALDMAPDTCTHIVCYCDDCRAFLPEPLRNGSANPVRRAGDNRDLPVQSPRHPDAVSLLRFVFRGVRHRHLLQASEP